jgi:hypothetical protein
MVELSIFEVNGDLHVKDFRVGSRQVLFSLKSPGGASTLLTCLPTSMETGHPLNVWHPQSAAPHAMVAAVTPPHARSAVPTMNESESSLLSPSTLVHPLSLPSSLSIIAQSL